MMVVSSRLLSIHCADVTEREGESRLDPQRTFASWDSERKCRRINTHNHISIDPYRAPLMVAMTAMTISPASDTTKLSKELVERAAAGRHQDVDRLLKDGADTWIREPVHVQCQTRVALYGIVWHCLALYGIVWFMVHDPFWGLSALQHFQTPFLEVRSTLSTLKNSKEA